MNEALLNTFQKYVIGNYRRYPVCLVKGEGSRVWDDQGNSYLDFFPGWGCGLIGHCPPRLVKAVQDQVAKLIHVPNTWYTEPQGSLAEQLVHKAGWEGKCFFCNSGTEANEAAIKIARLNGGPGRFKIITALNSFHGRTYGSLSATGQPKYHHGVEPMLPGFSYVPFGDLHAMRKAVDAETCAIMVEPIQGEGGVNVPSDEYLPGLRKICDENKLMLILDEVQSGMGRTGKWFSHHHWGITPDCVTLAKSLAGGVACGGLIAREPFASKLVPGTHAATFGGNPIACVAALATIETIEQEGLLERGLRLGNMFKQRFEAFKAKCPLIVDVRAKGTMVGIELSQDGTSIVQKCMEKKLLINCTHQTVIRLLPALNLTDDEFEEGCAILESALLSN